MWRRILITVPVLVLIGIVAAFTVLPARIASDHQRSVTVELAEWEAKYGSMASHADAMYAAQLLSYVQQYYVPCEGYRGTLEVEGALATQRQSTINTLVSALREYANADYGTDASGWLTYLLSLESDKDRSVNP